jgi:NAD(P)-dependent dehydrogenase (short-subunit alcohol dehydrogenase family)
MRSPAVGGQVAYPGLSIYHLSKWGIEGLFEAYAADVAPFGIHTTLVEPGMAATSFYGRGLPLQAKHLAAYEGTEMTQWLRGTAAYALVTEALAQRRADFEANRAVSVSTDRDDWVDTSAHERVTGMRQL